jgi:hypothetical protein
MVNYTRLEEDKMASLQCSKCGEGIHYHSLPQGIEYTYFSKKVWKDICRTKFDKNNKIMDESGVYPKLFRTSTIENDYSGQYLKLWECPICGTFHLFSDKGTVKKVFVRENSIDTYDYLDTGIMFVDYLWDEVTENDISNDRLISIQPSFYVRMDENHMVISKTHDFSEQYIYSVYEPEWMNE